MIEFPPSFEGSKGGKKIEGLSDINSNAINNNNNNNKTSHSGIFIVINLSSLPQQLFSFKTIFSTSPSSPYSPYAQSPAAPPPQA